MGRLRETLTRIDRQVQAFDFTTYERLPSGRDDDTFARNVEILTVEQMAKLADVPVEMVSRWIKHGQLDPLKHAASQPVQLADVEGAKRAYKEGNPFIPRYAKQPAAHVFLTFLLRPIGLRRLLSLDHRREMQNLDRGMPASYMGPGDPITDELVTDMKHAMDKGQPPVDVALNRLNPKAHDEKAAAAEKSKLVTA